MKFIKILTAGMLGFTLIFPAAQAQQNGDEGFSDLDTFDQFYDAIIYLKGNNIVHGYPDGSFDPFGKINRAEFIKIIIGSITDNPQGSNCFTDVFDEWFAPFVCEAKTRNLIDGFPDGSFRPAENINFSEAAKILANAFGLGSGTVDPDPELWFRQFVEPLADSNAIPLSVEYFDEDLLRNEMAEMIWRLHAEETEKSTRTYGEIRGEELVTGLSCAELRDRGEFIDRNFDFGGGLIMEEFEVDLMEPAMVPTDEVTTGAPPPAESKVVESDGGADDFSTTNIQVAGVDEADIIKNDGKYIYLIKGSTIRIVEAYPEENLNELLSFSLGDEDENFFPTEMYVDGDTMVVIGSVFVYFDPESGDASDEFLISLPYEQDRTRVYVVDITDRSAPEVTRTVEFDGFYNTSRKVGDTLYAVLNRYSFIPYYLDTDSPNESVIPQMLDSRTGRNEMVVPCGDVHIMPRTTTQNFIVAAAIPLKDLDREVDREVLVGDGDNVFTSRSNLYVAGTNWGPWNPIEGSAPFTNLYRFALGISEIQYETNGKVPGTVLNQFSMDEYKNHLRIATTEENFGVDFNRSNNLFILDMDMNIVGSVENIAPNEAIFSARFMGDRAYLVTFERVDPLFVIDVSDPKNPHIEGELKIPGFSEYLHPFDENHLIGFGRDVDIDVGEQIEDDDFIVWEQLQGLKISLFDVTDVKNPVEKFTEIIGDRGTNSELLYNHKALLFDREKELMAFPVEVQEYKAANECSDQTYSDCDPSKCMAICVPSACTFENGIRICTTDCDGPDSCVPEDIGYPEHTFAGAYVYNVNLDDGFTRIGEITHLNEDDQLDLTETSFWDWQKNIQRILYIGENLYTVSQAVVKANNLETLEELNMIELAPSPGDFDFGEPEPFPFFPL